MNESDIGLPISISNEDVGYSYFTAIGNKFAQNTISASQNASLAIPKQHFGTTIKAVTVYRSAYTVGIKSSSDERRRIVADEPRHVNSAATCCLYFGVSNVSICTRI